MVVLRGTGLGIEPAVEAPLVGVEPDDHGVVLPDMAPDPGQELGTRAARPVADLQVAAGGEGPVVDAQQQLAALRALAGRTGGHGPRLELREVLAEEQARHDEGGLAAITEVGVPLLAGGQRQDRAAWGRAGGLRASGLGLARAGLHQEQPPNQPGGDPGGLGTPALGGGGVGQKLRGGHQQAISPKP